NQFFVVVSQLAFVLPVQTSPPEPLAATISSVGTRLPLVLETDAHVGPLFAVLWNNSVIWWLLSAASKLIRSCAFKVMSTSTGGGAAAIACEPSRAVVFGLGNAVALFVICPRLLVPAGWLVNTNVVCDQTLSD